MLAIGPAVDEPSEPVDADEPHWVSQPIVIEQVSRPDPRTQQTYRVGVLLVEQNSAMALEISSRHSSWKPG